MVLSIYRPAAASLVGPGYKITVRTSVLPVPNDDYYTVGVRNPDINQNYLVAGQARTNGFQDTDVVLGLGIPVPFYFAIDTAVAQGATVRISIYQWHANGNFVDNVNVDGFKWDALGGAYILALWTANGQTPNATLAEILAAVKKTLPRTN